MQKILTRLAELIAEGQALTDAWRDPNAGDDEQRRDRAQRTARWHESCKHVLTYVELADLRQTFIDTTQNEAYPAYQLSQLVGVMESARDEVAAGFVGDIRYLLHADIFDSLVEQSDELSRQGHLVPAAVLGRIVIERWLYDEADRHGVAVADDDKSSSVNDRLKKERVFATAKWRRVQGFLDVGNAAAHGKTDEFNESDVHQMLDFIRANCL